MRNANSFYSFPPLSPSPCDALRNLWTSPYCTGDGIKMVQSFSVGNIHGVRADARDLSDQPWEPDAEESRV